MQEVIVISDDEGHDKQQEQERGEEQEEEEGEEGSNDDEGPTERGRLASVLGISAFKSDKDWAPWKTDKDKQRDELIGQGVIDGKYVICSKHRKQRLVSKMLRLPGQAELYECPPDSVCHVGDSEKKEDPRGGNDKRYYGSMRSMVTKKRTWRKVCWECGIGEHEKYACPNKLCPDTCLPVQQPTRYASNGYALAWNSEQHLLRPEEMSESSCIVCGKKGSVNCCSRQLATQPSCAFCIAPGHSADECLVNSGANYHARPGTPKGGKGFAWKGRSSPPPSGGSYASTTPVRRGGNRASPVPRPPPSVRLPPPLVSRPASVAATKQLLLGMSRAEHFSPPLLPPPHHQPVSSFPHTPDPWRSFSPPSGKKSFSPRTPGGHQKGGYSKGRGRGKGGGGDSQRFAPYSQGKGGKKRY